MARVTIEDLAQMVAAGFEEVNKKIDGLQGEMRGVKADVFGLKSDVGELKNGLAEVKSDVAELKSDVAELKSDVAELKSGQERIEHELHQAVSSWKDGYKKLDGRLSKLENVVAVNKSRVATRR